MATLTIHPDYRPLLVARNLADFDALFSAAEGHAIDGHRTRAVSRLRLRDAEGRPVVIYLKREWGTRAGASWRDLLRLRWPMPNARREWVNAMKLAAAGIRVAPPVAWGFGAGPDGPRSLIAFCEVPGQSLAALIHAVDTGLMTPSPQLRRAVAGAVGRAVRLMHQAGFSFPDLYAKHLYLENLDDEEPDVVLIDLARVRRLAGQRAAWDLAALLASTARRAVHATDRLRTMCAYLDRRHLHVEDRALIRRIGQIAAGMAGRGKDPNLIALRRTAAPGMVPLAQEKMTVTDGGRLIINEAFRPVLEASGLMTLDAIMGMPGGEPFRQAAGRLTVRVELPEPGGGRRALYVKRYTSVPLAMRLHRTLSLNPPVSQARREAGGIARLADLGIAAMRPVAFGEELPNRGRAERSCLITEEVGGATQADKFCEAEFAPPCSSRKTGAKRRLVRAMGDLARRLHAARLSHRDFYLCHILVRPVDGGEPVLHLIDLQRLTRHRRRMGRRWIVKDLGALLFSSWPSPATHVRSNVFTDTDRMRFVRAYFGTPRLTAEQKAVVRAVVAKALWIARHEEGCRARQEARA
jgi:heptose I phosphotransferase